MQICKVVVVICVWCVAHTVVAQERRPEQPQAALVIALRNDLPPMSFLNVDGQLTGLFVDVWNVWAAKTGQPIKFRAATWQETLDSLQNGAADVIGALYASEDRRAWMAFSQPLYASGSSLFYVKNQGNVLSISALAGQKVGVVGGAVQEQELRQNYPEITPVLFPTLEAMIPDARAGEIRAFVGAPTATLTVLNRLGLTNEFAVTAETLFARQLHAGVLKDRAELLALIDRGFDAISNQELAEIEARWVPDSAQRYYRTATMIRLTAAEDAWLKTHKTVKISIPTVFPPLMFLADNRIQGIIPDYLALFNARAGLQFEMAPASLDELLGQLTTRQIDLFPAFMKVEPNPLLHLTEACFTLNWVIVNRLDAPFFRNAHDLHGLNVAVVKDIPIYQHLRNNFPNIVLRPFETPADALASVAKGRPDAFIGALPVVGYLIQQQRLANLKIAGDTGLEDFLFSFAVRSDEPELVGILNKALHSVTQAEHDAIFHTWLPVRYERAANWQTVITWALGVGGVLVAFLGLALFWNRRLAHEIAERRRAEATLQANEKTLHAQNEALQSFNEEYQAMNAELAQTNDHLLAATRRVTESETRFRQLFHHAPVGIFVHQQRGPQESILVNEAFAAFTGYARSELESMAAQQVMATLFDPNGVAQESELIRQLLAREIPSYQMEKSYRQKSGRVVYGDVSVSLVMDDPPQTFQVIAVVQDITARKQAEEALVKSEERLRLLIESSADMITIHDFDGTYLYYSGPEKYAIDPANVIGKTPYDFFEKDIADQLTKQIKETAQTGESVNIEIYANWQGRMTWFEEKIYPTKKDQKIISVVKICSDITKRKNAEMELVTAKEAAESANRAKSAFLAHMSHELRTPLNGILGYAQILARDPALTEGQRDGVNVIMQSGNHLLLLINDILDLAKIEAGKIELAPDDFHLPGLVQSVIPVIRIRAEQKGLRVRLDAEDLPPTVHGDEQRLRQVLMNLLGNAVKFTDTGSVTLRILDLGFKILDLEDSQVNRSLPKSKINNLKFEIIDTGVGIASTDLERIFEPFQQVGDPRRQAQGTGLGLAISRKLIRLMGGELHVASAPGQGSIFWFELSLPVGQTAPDTTAASRRAIIGMQGPARVILVVDDLADNRAVLVNLLTPVGFRVIEATDGCDGLAKAQASQPDLIVIDIRMPEIGGCEMIRQLRQSPACRAIPVIVISASAFAEDRQHSLDAGAQVFLSKPVNADELFASVQQQLGLVWRYANETPAPAATEMSMALPPPDELAALYELAQIGDFSAIAGRVAQLARADPQWTPFVEEMQRLLKNFQLRKISAWLEPYSNTKS